MKKLKTFEAFKDTMVGQIFTSDYEDSISKIFEEIKNTYSTNNLSYDYGSGYIVYDLDGSKIEVRDDTFFAIPGYTIKVNGKEIECSYLLNRKIYKYLNNKWKEKEKEEISSSISDIGRSSNKYNL